MRFYKGSKVEVLCKKDVSLGAWRCAEIIVDGGDTYKVRYETTPGSSNGKISEVPSSSVRPCPPRASSKMNWTPGDIMEVLDDGTWKTATALYVMEGDCYLIRILGSFQEFKVHRSKTRLRQTWKDDKWLVLGKEYSSDEFAKSSNILDLICCEVPQGEAMIKFSDGKETNHLQDSYIVSARSLKRASPFCSSYAEAYPSKVRVIENQMTQWQVVSPLKEVVDVVSSVVNDLGDGEEGASSCYFERSTGISDSDDSNESETCSVVASCSVNRNNDVLAGPREDADSDCCSDAESFCWRRDDEEEEEEEDKCVFPLSNEEALKIHRLELEAYHSTMMVLHASGPLSWEKEALLTDLRIALHISNDEHLMELMTPVRFRTKVGGLFALLSKV